MQFFISLISVRVPATAALASRLCDPAEPENIGKLCFALFRDRFAFFAHRHLSSDILSNASSSVLTLATSAFPSVHFVGNSISKLR